MVSEVYAHITTYKHIHDHEIIHIVRLVEFIGVKLNNYIHEHETIPIVGLVKYRVI